jgi:ribonucleotide monophosphatase NagD (HAD superfamily)
MVGDSLEHDIAGGAAAGWTTAFVEGGLHARSFSKLDDAVEMVAKLASEHSCPLPHFTLAILR